MRTSRWSRLVVALVSLQILLVVTTSAWAQDNAAFDAELRRAVQLVQANKVQEAIPALEKLYASNSEHPALLEALAYGLAVSVLPDSREPEKRKATLLRARQLVEKAQKLGRNSELVQFLLATIPPDGDIPLPTGPAKNREAQDALAAGENAFAKGDFQAAIQNYERALKLEPTLYEAPLFLGDAYFAMGKADLAGESYAKAIAIDPDRDTAYRYWGDALMRANQIQQAKDKFIDAIIAEPYSRDTWQYLSRWGQRAGVQLGHPRIEVPQSPSGAWSGYNATRVSWRSEEKLFREAYPKEPKYRHSLREEVSSFGLVVETVQRQLKDGVLKEATLDISLANLLKVDKAGLLEAFILLGLPDEGISQDYVEYRKQNRDKLRQYLNDFVTGNK